MFSVFCQDDDKWKNKAHFTCQGSIILSLRDCSIFLLLWASSNNDGAAAKTRGLLARATNHGGLDKSCHLATITQSESDGATSQEREGERERDINQSDGDQEAKAAQKE